MMPQEKAFLKDILSLSVDPQQVSAEKTYPNLGIRGFARGVFKKPAIVGSDTSATTLYRVRAHQFIYSRLFAFEGAYSLVPADMDGWFVSNEFPVFNIDTTRILSGYLRWLFTCPHIWREMAASSKGMGDRRQRIHPERLLEYQIGLPALNEQRLIVAKLDKVAALIAERRQAIECAERETQALLLNAFERATYGAPYRPMAEAAPLVRRPIAIRQDGLYAELGVRSFGRGTFHKPAVPGAEIGSKKLFCIREGDLLFNIVFAWEGAVAIAQSRDDGRVGSHRFLSCVPEAGLATTEFLRFYFLTAEGLQRLGEASPGGAGRNRTLGLKKLEAIEIPLPTIEKQQWFNRIQAQVRTVRAIREHTAADIEALTPAMLHEAFSGGAAEHDQRRSRLDAERPVLENLQRNDRTLPARRLA